MSAEEGAKPTEYEKIFIAKNVEEKYSDKFTKKINQLIKISCKNNSEDEIVKLLKELVPTYKPSEHKSLIFTW